MSLYDYEQSRKLSATDQPFYALIMAAMRRADTDNLTRLQSAFPEVWRELQARYNAPGGMLPGERDDEAPEYSDDDKPVVALLYDGRDDATGVPDSIEELSETSEGRVIDLMQALKDSLAEKSE
jgi:hypothetical protein